MTGRYEVSRLFSLSCVDRADVRVPSSERSGTNHETASNAQHSMRSILALPPVELRDVFESMARPMLDLRLNLLGQIQALREARDLLLPRLVSGELDVSELDLGLVAV